MTRKYKTENRFSDFAEDVMQDSGKKMQRCPCCGIVNGAGEKAQADYFSMVDDLYRVLLNPERKIEKYNAAANLIERLNDMAGNLSKIDYHPNDNARKTESIYVKVKKLSDIMIGLTMDE